MFTNVGAVHLDHEIVRGQEIGIRQIVGQSVGLQVLLDKLAKLVSQALDGMVTRFKDIKRRGH